MRRPGWVPSSGGSTPLSLRRLLTTLAQIFLLLNFFIGSYYYLFICRPYHEHRLPHTPLPQRSTDAAPQVQQPQVTSRPTSSFVASTATQDLLEQAEKKSKVLLKRLDRSVRFTKSRAFDELVHTYASGDPSNDVVHNGVRFDIVTTAGTLKCRTAPLNLVPIAVRYFLEMVENNFWDNRSQFFRSESHVVQATPDYAKDAKKFPAHGIEIQDYSSEYPHKLYTLGIAGRPGGPDFYVNLQSNEKIHGPGGQGHNYKGDEESDPCFAELIDEESKKVIREIQNMKTTKNGGLKILNTPVSILSITVVRE